jgi:hypothetical protein
MMTMGPTVLLPLTDEQLALLGVALDQVRGLDAELEPIRVLMRRAAEQRRIRIAAFGQADEPGVLLTEYDVYHGVSAPPPRTDERALLLERYREMLRP